LTVGKLACANQIENCTSYSDDTLCESCNTSTILTVGKLVCPNQIENCTSYSVDTLCESCNTSTILTVGKLACANQIESCTSYSDDTLCESCNTSTILTVGKLACANQIENCTSYSDDTLCEFCNTSTILTVGKLACANQIENCTSYSDNTLCASCNTSTVLTVGKLACANQIENCTSYSDNTLCESCNISTILTVGKLACANQIENCTSYSDDTLCEFCNTSTILTVGKLACANQIENCTTYSDNSLCQSCNVNYFLENNSCKQSCSFGYYTTNSSNICNLCDSFCLTCQESETNCTSCPDNIFLENSTCLVECSLGYYFIDGSNFCYQCDASCLTCQHSSTNCTSKKLDATAKFGKITDPLTLPFSFSSSFPELFSMIANVSVVSISNFQTNDFNFLIKNTSDPLTFNLILSFNVSLIGDHTLNLTFNLPSEIFDINNRQLQTKTLTTSLINFYILNDDDQTSLETIKETISGISIPTTASINIFAFINSGSSFLFTILFVLHFITFLKFLNINYPPNALAVLEIDFTLFNILPSYAIDHKDIPVDLKYAYYEIDNYVVNNLGKSFLEKLIILAIAFSLNLLNGKCDKIFRKFKLFNLIFNKIYKTLCWNFVLNSMISCLNDYFFYSFVNLTFPTYDKIGILNLCLSSVNTLFCLFFMIFIYFKILKIHQLLRLDTRIILDQKKYATNDDFLDSPSFADPSISRIVSSQRKVFPKNNQESIETNTSNLKPATELIKEKNTTLFNENVVLKNLSKSNQNFENLPKSKQKPLILTRVSTVSPTTMGTTLMEATALETQQVNKKDIQNSEKIESFMEKFKILCEDFKHDSKLTSTYFILDLIKYPLLSAIIILDRTNPLRQTITISIICIVMMVFLIIVRPYKSTSLLMINISSQMCVLFCLVSALILSYYDNIDFNDQERRFLIGKIFSFATLGLIYLMAIIVIGHTAISVIRTMKLTFY